MGKQKQFHFRQRRYYSEQFKRTIVKEITTGKATIKELSILYDIAQPVLYRWVHKYDPPKQKTIKCIYQMPSEAKKTQYYKKRVAELERLLGKQAAKVAYLEELLAIVEEKYGEDVKKIIEQKLSRESEAETEAEQKKEK